MSARSTGDDKRAGDHPAAGVVAGAFQNRDQAAPHAVGGEGARPAVHDQHAAIHAREFAGQRCAEVIAGVAENLDTAAAHAGPGMRAGIAFHRRHFRRA